MKKGSLLLPGLIFLFLQAQSQNVGIGTNAPHQSAALQISSTNKGLLIPQMSYNNMASISNPAAGLMLYETDTKTTRQFDGLYWQMLNPFRQYDVNGNNVLLAPFSSNTSFLVGLNYMPVAGDPLAEGVFFMLDRGKDAVRLGSANNNTTSLWPVNIGIQSVGIGTNNRAPGYQAVAVGFGNNAMEDYSMTFGYELATKGIHEIALGKYNDTSAASQIFSIGNGSSLFRENALTILANSKIGIGTVAPAARLHVTTSGSVGSPQLMVEEQNDAADGARISFKNGARPNNFWDLFGFTAANNADARFNIFHQGYGDVMSLAGNGRVGIGTNAATATLHVRSTASSSVPQAHLQVTQDSYVRMRMSNTTNPLPYWDMAALTHVSTPTSAQLNFFYSQSGGNGLDVLSLKGNGNAAFAGTVTANGVTLTSDARLKKDISPLHDALPLLEQLHGYQYYWKDQSRDSSLQTGMLAQEVEKAMPELVKEDDQGTKSVNYLGMIPYLLEAVKTLSAQNSELRLLLSDLQKAVSVK